MNNPIIILGTGGLGRAVLEIFETNNNIVYGFLNDDKKNHQTQIDKIQVLGDISDNRFLKLIGEKCDAFIASDDNKLKKSLAKMLKKERKIMPVNAVHNSAIVATSAKIGYGNFINAGAIIGAGVDIANHCLLHSNSVIDHNVTLGDLVQIGAGSIINSKAVLDEGVFIGTGSVIVSGIKIKKNARIGAGSLVIADVPEGVTVFSNPAQELKK